MGQVKQCDNGWRNLYAVEHIHMHSTHLQNRDPLIKKQFILKATGVITCFLLDNQLNPESLYVHLSGSPDGEGALCVQ